MLQKRQEYKEKTKGALVFGEMPNEKKSSKGRGRKAERDYVSDSGGSDAPMSPSQREVKQKRRKRYKMNMFASD